MKPEVIVTVVFALVVYTSFLFVYLRGRKKQREIEKIMSIVNHGDSVSCLQVERNLMERFKIPSDSAATFLLVERVIVIILLVFLSIKLRGLVLLAVGSLVIIFIANDGYQKAIYESGITNIGKVTNFINYFVPHINSGNSADQSLLGYIEYSKDEDLVAYYENRENMDYEIPTHLKQIIEIYSIAKYNEEQGISDYSYILNELSNDMSQKQVYYNNFISRIGEIQPIMWSYYFGVPILIVISFSQTYNFWMGLGGYIVSAILLILFACFKFLIFKLQKNTVNAIF